MGFNAQRAPSVDHAFASCYLRRTCAAAGVTHPVPKRPLALESTRMYRRHIVNFFEAVLSAHYALSKSETFNR